MSLAEYGASNMDLALRGLELKTLDPYLADRRCRVVPALGHFPVRMITNGAVDRTVHGWIADQHSRSTVKNSLAVLVRVMEQAVRDGILTVNPARVTGWQREYKQAEDELDNPRPSPCATGPPCSASPRHSPTDPTTTTEDGARSSSSPPRPPPASARSPASAPATSTPRTGSGPSAGRPPPHPADSPTRTPKANAPAKSPSSRKSAR